MERVVCTITRLCDEAKALNEFFFLEDKLNARGGNEATVTARVRIGWGRFSECVKLLLEIDFF